MGNFAAADLNAGSDFGPPQAVRGRASRRASDAFAKARRGAMVIGSLNAMKLQDTLVRLKRFQVEEKRRRVAQIESMVEEFSKIARELDQEVAIEEQRAGIFDSSHFAYPTYARAARARRDNLNRSAVELMAQLEDARNRLEEAAADLDKAQGLGAREAGDSGGDTSLAVEKSAIRLRAARA